MTKYIDVVKKSIIGGLVFTFTVFTAVYAASIVSYTETASDGDTITAEWANSIKNILPIDSSKITDDTITESDISDSFKARDADLLDGVDSSLYATKTYVDSSLNSWPAGNYCIFRAGGSCPSGFTAGSGHLKALSIYNSASTTYLTPLTFGDSRISRHGSTNRSDLVLNTCCK